MDLKRLSRTSMLLSAVALALLTVGCGHETAEQIPLEGDSSTVETADTNQDSGDANAPGCDGWWCSEHGVQEESCSLCSSKAAADFKEKGDWCDEHNRAESQCFLCDPSRAEKFANLYEAKFGQAPPDRATD